jgi:hypothetical protein
MLAAIPRDPKLEYLLKIKNTLLIYHRYTRWNRFTWRGFNFFTVSGSTEKVYYRMHDWEVTSSPTISSTPRRISNLNSWDIRFYKFKWEMNAWVFNLIFTAPSPLSREESNSGTRNKKKFWNFFSNCACHPCAGAMLIFSVLFQF